MQRRCRQVQCSHRQLTHPTVLDAGTCSAGWLQTQETSTANRYCKQRSSSNSGAPGTSRTACVFLACFVPTDQLEQLLLLLLVLPRAFCSAQQAPQTEAGTQPVTQWRRTRAVAITGRLPKQSHCHSNKEGSKHPHTRRKICRLPQGQNKGCSTKARVLHDESSQ